MISDLLVISKQGCGSRSWQRLNFWESESNWKKKLEANLEAFDFLRSRKQKHFS